MVALLALMLNTPWKSCGWISVTFCPVARIVMSPPITQTSLLCTPIELLLANVEVSCKLAATLAEMMCTPPAASIVTLRACAMTTPSPK